jgi:hypothetical protein
MFKLFREQYLSQYVEIRRDKIDDLINMETNEYLLNVNEDEFCKYIESKVLIENLVLHKENLSVSDDEENRHYESHDFGRLIKRDLLVQVIIYHIPFEGDPHLLKCRPSAGLMWTENVYEDDQCLCYKIDSCNNPESIRMAAERFLNNCMTVATSLSAEVENNNQDLKAIIRRKFLNRKSQLQVNISVITSLGVPIKARKDIPKTFSVPVGHLKQKAIVAKPTTISHQRNLQPTLNRTDYDNILRVIHDVGKEYERLPSTYMNKSEEDIRDLFLLFLEANFEGSATGETFNRSGKTDILLRYEGNNVFVSECKFWSGEKMFMEAIDQLLGYLTWRDSKTAVILFVKNKDITSVIKKVHEIIKTHENFLRFVEQKDDSWSEYCFHLPGDSNCEISLAVLLFHFPPS